jgi:hypothetical protein
MFSETFAGSDNDDAFAPIGAIFGICFQWTGGRLEHDAIPAPASAVQRNEMAMSQPKKNARNSRLIRSHWLSPSSVPYGGSDPECFIGRNYSR